MVSTADFRNGLVFEWDNRIWQVVWFQHHKPGKGGAVRIDYRPVHEFTLTDDVDYIKPKARVY